jgi:peptidoglycan-associated lipoprotein
MKEGHNVVKHSQLSLVLLSSVVLFSTIGCAKKQLKDGSMASLQDAALRGEDIALSAENLNFVTPEDRATFSDLYFMYDRAEIEQASKKVLANISRWLNAHPSKHLLIEGHCDERGTREYNLSLGEQRSLAVRRYLTSLGINPKKLHTISYGEERPAVQGHDEQAWQKNRRAHFLVSE